MTDQHPKKTIVLVKSLVVNENNEILFVKRKWEERKDVHGKWELPGGKVDFQENPENTAVRETLEESGYKVKAEYLLPKVISQSGVSPSGEYHLILMCYVCKLLGGESILKDHGVSEIKWFKLNNLPKKEDCLEGTMDFLEVYKKGVK